MFTRCQHVRLMLVVGIIVLVLGMIDPLEGAFLTLIGTGLLAIAALLGASRYANLLTWAVWLVSAGVGIMIALSCMGGVGGNSGHVAWWLLLVVPFPIGLILALIGGIGALEENWKSGTRRSAKPT